MSELLKLAALPARNNVFQRLAETTCHSGPSDHQRFPPNLLIQWPIIFALAPSVLEDKLLVAMAVHSVYEAGVHEFKATNHPAMAWIIAHTFGGFLGAGVWGFMQTLPQINLYKHDTNGRLLMGILLFST